MKSSTCQITVGLCIAIALGASPARSEDTRHAEVCDLARNAANYADQTVEVTGEIAFSYHTAMLVDSRCKFAVTVWFPTDQAVRPDLNQLISLRLSSMSGEIRIFGNFRGRFRDNTKQDPQRFFEDGVPFILLELEAASNLRTVPK